MSQMPPPMPYVPPIIPPAGAPAYKLYDVAAVGLATFLGSPFAGSAILAINYKRLGRASAAWGSLLAGALATVLLLVLGMLLPDRLGYGAGIGALVGAISAARSLQGGAIEAHKSAGGKMASLFFAAGIGVAMMALIFGVIFAYIMLTPPLPGAKYTVGNDEIYYSGAATEADAKTFGERLKDIGYFKNRGVTMQLVKGNKTVIGFVVHDGAWDDAKMVDSFETITHLLASSVGGLPVEVHMLDASCEVRKSWMVK